MNTSAPPPDFYWHIHHDVLCEPLIEPIENRIAYIKAAKPPYEVATRLRLMQPVRGPLPATYAKAWATYAKAWDTYAKAGATSGIATLHAQECPDCPWDGKTIFPKGKAA